MNNYDALILGALLGVGILSAANTTLLMRRLKATSRSQGKAAVIDTCALIDGRIVDIARAGFVPAKLLVPRAVVRELQYMADQQDTTKRERARFGLDMINELQQLKGVEVQVIQHKDTNTGLVDEALIALAKQYSAQLFTTDYNLNKVAQVEGVNVLNVNELAQALRPHYLPGEKLQIKLVQPGQGNNQAVGYLDDGTMVVVEQAKKLVGKQVLVTFTRILQTQAGKMLFATLDTKSGERATSKVTKPSGKKPFKRTTNEDNMIAAAK